MYPKFSDYFKFNKLERRGVFLLLILIAIILLARVWKRNQPYDSELTAKAILAFMELDSLARIKHSQENEPMPTTIDDSETSYFEFDPNTITYTQWESLGFTKRQIDVIQNYLNKGGKFRIKSDLKKMYSVSEAKYKKLEPYLLLPDSFPKYEYLKKRNFKDRKSEISNEILQIEVNTADSAQFTQLYGIGPTLSKRIIKYRNALGGFYSLDQIREVYGIKDSVYKSLKRYLSIDSSRIEKFNINRVESERLKKFPYLTWNQANAIVNYRKQHGGYQGFDHLYKVKIIDSATVKKLTPYILFD